MVPNPYHTNLDQHRVPPHRARPGIERYFQNHSENVKHRRTAWEWFAVHELASVLEPASEVTTRIQGNADRFPSRNTFLMKKLRDL